MSCLMSFHVMSVMPCHVMSCHVKSCHVSCLCHLAVTWGDVPAASRISLEVNFSALEVNVSDASSEAGVKLVVSQFRNIFTSSC